MKYILAIIGSIILPISSLKEMILVKNCNDCKFFVPNRFTHNNAYGKCSLYPIVKNSIESLVTGIEEMDYIYCTTVRKYNYMCGEEGKLYEKIILEHEYGK